jgi:MoaA/NifB/PqqE/SkfB family radical SAM enzyme
MNSGMKKSLLMDAHKHKISSKITRLFDLSLDLAFLSVSKRKFVKKRQMHRKNIARFITLTYKCNSDCNFCYAKGLNKQYKEVMDLEDFEKLLDWFENQKIKNISVTGGEPTGHPNFKEIIDIINRRKFRMTIFTNGLFPSTFLDKVIKKKVSFILNYRKPEEYSQVNSKLLDKNLQSISDKKLNIRLVYNMSHDNTDPHYILDACKNYKINHVILHVVFPNISKNNEYVSFTQLNQMGSSIVKNVDIFMKNDIQVVILRPLPFCIFTTAQRLWLEKNADLHGVCLVGSRRYYINTDLSLLPCSVLSTDSSLKGPNIFQFNSEKEAIDYYSDSMTRLKWKPLIKECLECNFYKQKECQGGCLIYKLVN